MKAKSLEVDLVIWEMETKGRAFQKRWDTKSRGRWVSVSRPESMVHGWWQERERLKISSPLTERPNQKANGG